MAPLVDQLGRRLRVPWLDPSWKQMPLLCLEPEVLIQIRVCDLLQGLDLDYGDEVRVQVHELDRGFFELPHGHQVPLNTVQRLVGVIVGLFYEPQLCPRLLVESDCDS